MSPRYRPLPGKAPRKAPWRRFGIFRLPTEVRYTSGEETVEYLARSLWVLVAREALPVMVSLLVLLITFLVPATGPLSGGLWVLWQNLLYFAVPSLALWIFLIWLDYADDVYILTTKRIIEIERSFWFFPKKRIEIEYKNIRDTKLKIPGLIGIFLNIGHVYVETPGTNPDIIFNYVDDPFKVQNRINEIKSHQEKVEKIKKENEQKELLHRWFATVFTGLEKAVETKAASDDLTGNDLSTTLAIAAETRRVPNLKGESLSAAIAIAAKNELEIAVFGEAMESAEVPPGCVLIQNPPRGTMMKKGSAIEVVLCKRPSLVDSF